MRIYYDSDPFINFSQYPTLVKSNNIPVINGSQLITAIHQNHDYNHLSGRRLEAFQINIDPAIAGLSLRYMAHIAAIGDTPLTPEGELVGERGKNRQIEGLAIELIGPQAPNYKVFYTAHIQNKGDVPVCTNGEYCGTKGQGLRIEGMKIWIEAK